MLDRLRVQDAVLKLGHKLVRDGVLLGISLLSGTGDDQVNLSGRSSDELSGLGRLGLQIDIDAGRLLNIQSGESTIGLKVHTLAVDNLNTRNNVVKQNIGLLAALDGDVVALALNNNNALLALADDNSLLEIGDDDLDGSRNLGLLFLNGPGYQYVRYRKNQRIPFWTPKEMRNGGTKQRL